MAFILVRCNRVIQSISINCGWRLLHTQPLASPLFGKQKLSSLSYGVMPTGTHCFSVTTGHIQKVKMGSGEALGGTFYEHFVWGVEFQKSLLPSLGCWQNRIITSDDLTVLYILIPHTWSWKPPQKQLYFQNHDINFKLLYKVVLYFTAMVH